MTHRIARLAGLFIFLCTNGVAWAQTGASLSGTVTDQDGAALRDVAVTIINVDTAATRTIATDGRGHYQALGLPPGQFEIRAAKQGFTTETRTEITLAVGQDATAFKGADLTLHFLRTAKKPPPSKGGRTGNQCEAPVRILGRTNKTRRVPRVPFWETGSWDGFSHSIEQF